MPRLLVLAAAKGVVTDKDTLSVSMFGLIGGFDVNIPANQQIPVEANVLTEWAAIAMWRSLEGDMGKTFEQRTQLCAPNSNVAWESLGEFQFEKENHHMVIRGTTFPIGQEGLYRLLVSVREIGSQTWIESGDYPIRLTWKPN